ncbi:hypothetical protein [Paenibacillus brevis]|uniref:hypothetical protein n=1 Tax=Paenibacillus brevis TaxID=2841508 RepID=UPI001C0FE9BC|nr:hypothetical protein [Paenibacillus brevis]
MKLLLDAMDSGRIWVKVDWFSHEGLTPIRIIFGGKWNESAKHWELLILQIRSVGRKRGESIMSLKRDYFEICKSTLAEHGANIDTTIEGQGLQYKDHQSLSRTYAAVCGVFLQEIY